MDSADQVDLLLDQLLVIALQAQRPDLDFNVLTNINYHLQDYGARLGKLFPLGRPAAGGADFYQPSCCVLWGDYDFATFYLGEDLESIAYVSNTSTAPAQEFLFGSPYFRRQEPRSTVDALEGLFHPDRATERPLVAISRIKLGDHLLAVAGGELRRAMARWIFRRADEHGVSAIVLRCWSWPELVVVLTGHEPTPLLRLLKEVEEAGIHDLRQADPDLERAFHQALDHEVGYFLLKRWVFGRDRKRQTRDRPPAEILEELGRRDAVVAAKSQLGILAAGWPGNARVLLGEFLCRAYQQIFDADKTPGLQREEVEELRGELQRVAQEIRPGTDGDEFTARILLQAKPGHAGFVQEFGTEVAKDLGSDRARVRAATIGYAESVVLSLQIPPTIAGFLLLLCTSHSFRICPHVRSHLLGLQTQLEWSRPLPQHRKAAPPGQGAGFDPNRSSGYALLIPVASLRAMEFQRRQTTRRRIGRVEALALHAWYTAVEQITGRPEMFGAMIELYRGANTVYRELFLHDDEEDGYLLAQSVLEMGDFFQRAYQQRLQFSPVVTGAPPINGQLPFGVNQIVRMVDGLAATVTQAAFLADADARIDPDLPARTNLVIFDADPALATMSIHDFGLLKLSLLQAMTPLSLTLLFHELGHLLIRRSFWQGRRKRSYREFLEGRRQWWEMRDEMARAVLESWRLAADKRTRKSGERQTLWRQHLVTDLEDIFAHAVWRRIGCGNDWDLFVTQFLAGLGMGLRTRPGQRQEMELRPPEGVVTIWTAAAAHLFVQRLLFEHEDSIPGMRQALASCAELDTEQWPHLTEIIQGLVPYCQGEFHYFGDSTGLGDMVDGTLVAVLTGVFKHTWCPILSSLGLREGSGVERFWRRMAELFTSLETVDERLRIETAPGCRNPDLGQIRASIARGEPVDRIPWSILHKAQGGCPTEAAVLWAREILAGVTESFRQGCQGKPHAVSVRRNRWMEYAGIGTGGFETGVFVDFIGGLFATGTTERRDYLRVRLAAVESLASLGDRILAGPIGVRFLRRRRYLRKPETREPGVAGACGQTELRLLDGACRLRGRVTASVLNHSPIGAGLVIANGAGVSLVENDLVEVQSTSGAWRICRVAWTLPGVHGVDLGIEKLPDGEDDGSGAEPRPEEELEWTQRS